ncbi:MAG: MBL fold metallo-hydrolase [Flaviflexus sp.]|nr:MBL fold metallo-hydrolase [Flaviflexus sp.]
MKLTVIGCSGSMSGPHGPASAYLVETQQTRLLLDFGPGAMGQLFTYVDPASIDALVFSHLHTDHCADIIGMQVFRRWYPGLSVPPLPVYAPADPLERTRQIGGDPIEETYASEFDFRQVAPGERLAVGDLRIDLFPALHPVPALALRVTGPNGEVLTYSGDTDVCEGQVAAAKDADLFLCEAAFEARRDTVRGIHLTGERAGELAERAGVGRLVLTHLQPWTDPQVVVGEAREHYSGDVEVAKPGASYLI